MFYLSFVIAVKFKRGNKIKLFFTWGPEVDTEGS